MVIRALIFYWYSNIEITGKEKGWGMKARRRRTDVLLPYNSEMVAVSNGKGGVVATIIDKIL